MDMSNPVTMMTQKPRSVTRNYRDSVFRMLFKDKRRLLNLYNALCRTNYTDPEELVINTLENAIYLGRRNDISFVIHNQMYLFEHQSTVNPNMPLRNLLYISSLYNALLEKQNIYSKHRIMIPTPHFVTFYNGTEIQPERMVMKLSASFEPDGRNGWIGEGLEDGPDLELKVLQININKGYSKELMESCKDLQDYMLYVDRVRGYAKEMPVQEAVERAVDECIAEGILADFLAKNRAEVVMKLLFEYDQEEHYRMIAEEEKRYGREEGRAEGRTEGIREAVLEILGERSKVPEELEKRIEEEMDVDTLKRWLKLAIKADSLEEFVREL